jgi:exonuclease VII small subunit
MLDEAIAELQQAKEQYKLAIVASQSAYSAYRAADEHADECQKRLNSARLKLFGIAEGVEFQDQTVHLYEKTET